jgi:putative addiction module component (TIGR02574 family)
MSTDYSHLFDLSTADKLRIVEDLWDDIAAGAEPIPLPQWQIDELRRRKQLRKNCEVTGSSWEDVQRRVREQKGNG